MKLILSRKGFDAANGRYPSPILPGGALLSLPIPETHLQQLTATRPYQAIRAGDINLDLLVTDLTRQQIQPDTPAHLDPDLNAHSVPRLPGWKPLFGQAGAAEAHLQRQGVAAGDLFLFYGWFRQVAFTQGAYRYVPGAPDWHVLFGWLQIAQRISVNTPADIPLWAADHPHCQRRAPHKLDSLYVARDELDLPGTGLQRAGAGVFTHFDPRLRLTAPDSNRRSLWHLPAWFYPDGHKPPLSYHGRGDRWQRVDGFAQLQTVGRGQEFVLDCAAYPEVMDWLQTLFTI